MNANINVCFYFFFSLSLGAVATEEKTKGLNFVYIPPSRKYTFSNQIFNLYIFIIKWK